MTEEVIQEITEEKVKDLEMTEERIEEETKNHLEDLKKNQNKYLKKHLEDLRKNQIEDQLAKKQETAEDTEMMKH